MKTIRKRPALPPALDLQPRSEVLQASTAVHGGIDQEDLDRLGLDAGQILDFSVNTNPFGTAPGVREALANVALDCYPDPEARALRKALADHLDMPLEQILAGNGASELIWLVALTFLDADARVLVLGPTYSEYARSGALMGAAVTTLLAHPDDSFTFPANRILATLRRRRPRLVFLCNPNNPTGAFLESEEINSWARRFPSTLFVVDEAYLGFAMDQRVAGLIPAVRDANTAGMNPAARRNNVLLLRSMTKDLGLAGLRLGYALGPAQVTDWLARARPPWSVSSLAQAAGVEALRHPDYYRDSFKKLADAKTDLVRGLRALGYQPAASTMPFFLLPVADGSRFRFALLQKGILVRDAASFGLSGHVRISTRRPEDNARLLAALREVPYAS